MRNRRIDTYDIAPSANVSVPTPAVDDGLSPPMNRERVRERVAMAQAYLARNPIALRSDQQVLEIVGF